MPTSDPDIGCRSVSEWTRIESTSGFSCLVTLSYTSATQRRRRSRTSSTCCKPYWVMVYWSVLLIGDNTRKSISLCRSTAVLSCGRIFGSSSRLVSCGALWLVDCPVHRRETLPEHLDSDRDTHRLVSSAASDELDQCLRERCTLDLGVLHHDPLYQCGRDW